VGSISSPKYSINNHVEMITAYGIIQKKEVTNLWIAIRYQEWKFMCMVVKLSLLRSPKVSGNKNAGTEPHKAS